MEESPSNLLNFLVRWIHPWQLLAGLAFYCLGVGVGYYTGSPIDAGVFWIGLSIIILLLLSWQYIKGYYALLFLPVNRKRTNLQTKRIHESGLLLVIFTFLAIGAVLTVILFAREKMNLPALVIIGMALLLVFFDAIPPFGLASRGYGEVTRSVIIANLIPALGLTLQSPSFLPFLMKLVFPLTLLILAIELAISLEGYGQDLSTGRLTLMVRIGWERGIPLHNILILAFYLLIGVAVLTGLPWSLSWPVLLTLPVGLFLIWQMLQLAAGAKPRWKLLRYTAVGLLVVILYLYMLGLWV